MPNMVEDFVPWRVMLLVHNALDGIGLHAGYNTQPLVTMDYEEFRQSSIDYAVFVDCPDLRIVENDIGDGVTGATRAQPEIVFSIYGSVKTGTQQPQMALMSLAQDVLTALSLKPKDIGQAIGRSVTMRLGDVQMATFDLTGKKESVFSLEVVFRYSQGSTW